MGADGLLGGLGAVALGLAALSSFADAHAFMLNVSPSLPYWAIWLDRTALPKRGDIVLSANFHDIKSAAELEAAIRAAKTDGRSAVMLRIQRRGQSAGFLAVRLR